MAQIKMAAFVLRRNGHKDLLETDYDEYYINKYHYFNEHELVICDLLI
jgi:hypothetical protein